MKTSNVLLGGLALWLVFGAKLPKDADKPAIPDSPSIRPNEVLVGETAELKGLISDPKVKSQLESMWRFAADVVRREGETLGSTATLQTRIQRVEQLIFSKSSNVGKFPSYAPTIAKVLKSKNVLGPTVKGITAENKNQIADGLEAVAWSIGQ